jgi:hypothetical protein
MCDWIHSLPVVGMAAMLPDDSCPDDRGSGAGGNWVKWMTLILQAVCTVTAIAMVHSDNRLTADLAMGPFSPAAKSGP